MNKSKPRKLKPATPGRCRYCRCTDNRACEYGCSWADAEHTVCDSPSCLGRWAKALGLDHAAAFGSEIR